MRLVKLYHVQQTDFKHLLFNKKHRCTSKSPYLNLWFPVNYQVVKSQVTWNNSSLKTYNTCQAAQYSHYSILTRYSNQPHSLTQGKILTQSTLALYANACQRPFRGLNIHYLNTLLRGLFWNNYWQFVLLTDQLIRLNLVTKTNPQVVLTPRKGSLKCSIFMLQSGNL